MVYFSYFIFAVKKRHVEKYKIEFSNLMQLELFEIWKFQFETAIEPFVFEAASKVMVSLINSETEIENDDEFTGQE